MQKQDRQQTLIDLIGATRIGRQDQLVRELGERGFSVTQASVSRDLDELGIVKVNGAYSRPDRRSNGLGIALISLETAGPYMIVARTPSGLASATTVRVDSANLAGIVGTIAGDDTI